MSRLCEPLRKSTEHTVSNKGIVGSRKERSGRKSVRFEADAASSPTTEYFQIHDDSESDTEPPKLTDGSESEVERTTFDFDNDDEDDLKKQSWLTSLQQKYKPNTLLLIQRFLFPTYPSLFSATQRVEHKDGQTGRDRRVDSTRSSIQQEAGHPGTSSTSHTCQGHEDRNHGTETKAGSYGKSLEPPEVL